MSKIAMDFDIYHRRRWPDRPMSLGSCAWLVASSPGLRLLLMHRFTCWRHSKLKVGGWQACFWRIMEIALSPLKIVIKVSSKSEICHDSVIEDGVYFSDHGYIIFGALKTGRGTIIGTRVTVGMDRAGGGRPKIGHNVWIGSDCVIYGSISIGDGATLLPNTVLSKNIPPNVIMQGNPARLVLSDYDNSKLREHQNIDMIQHQNTMVA